jgi:gluconolactonase
MALMTVVDPAFERLVDPNGPAQRIATGVSSTEGPVSHSGDRCLIFNDIPGNTLYRWTEAKGHEVLRTPSAMHPELLDMSLCHTLLRGI